MDVRDIGAGPVCAGPGWEVTTATADHVQPWLDSLAYRLDEAEGSIVFTGDTAPCQTVVDLARDADVMVAMCGGEQQAQIESGTAFGQMGTVSA